MERTSLEAFEKILPKIGDRQVLVLGFLHFSGESTDAMIAAGNRERLPINCITPRRGELVKKGLVTESFKGICQATKGHATYWKITERGKDVLDFKNRQEVEND